MKYLKFIFSFIFLLFYFLGYTQTYAQPVGVISAGGGESSGGNYSNFDVIGGTFVNQSVTGGNYSTSIGFLFSSLTLTGINEIPSNIVSLKVFPNPTRNKINVTMDITKAKTLTIELLNIAGGVLWQETAKYRPGQFTKTIDLSPYSKGIHILLLTADDGTITRKIVLE
ncbi:MAG: T9SS type A sorting domain-containing protein [Bacteroidales bacterium]|nr:T9SS type A sorting domain-containing protein [Bacteroidales bacterium]